MSVTVEDFRRLRNRPFDLLVALGARYGRSAEAGGTTASSAGTWPGLTVRLGGIALVVPQREVREVRDVPPYTRVPHAPPWLLGLANMRGDLLPVIDLQQVLTGQPGSLSLESRLLVFNHPEIPAGFLVDKVEGLRRYRVEEQRHARVSEAPAEIRPHLLGALEREGQLRWVLGLRRLSMSERFQGAAA